MTLVQAAFSFIAAAGIVVVAASALTRFADSISRITGLGRLFVGSLLLAGATSLPEFMVDFHAVRSGMADLAAGDLFGSSLFNLLILAGADIATRKRGGIRSCAAPRHVIAAVLAVVLTSLVAMAMVAPSHPQIPGPGFFGFAILAAYVIGLRLVIRSRFSEPAAAQEPSSGKSGAVHTLGTAVSGFAASAGVILLASPHVAANAGRIATESGLGESFVGTTLVAWTTSLPELTATVAALRMAAPDLALGNILGSNSFNMVLFVPLDIACRGCLFTTLSSTHQLAALAVIIATSLTIVSLVHHPRKPIPLLDPDSWLVALTVCAAIALVYLCR